MSLVLANATVITCATGSPLLETNVLVEDGRIAEVSRRLPQAANVIDCSGRVVIPGLWDMHAHIALYGEACLHQMVHAGITGVRDMGGDFETIDTWRQEIDDRTRIGPRIFTAGPFIDGPKSMRPDRAKATLVVETPRDTRNAVHQVHAQRVDFVKVHSRLPRPCFRAVVEESKRLGLDLAVHLPVTVTMEDVIDAGIHSLEHADAFLESAPYIENEQEQAEAVATRFAFIDSDAGSELLRRFVSTGTWLTPTIVPYATVFKDHGTEMERALPKKLLALTAKLHRLGASILAGSDFAWPEVGIRPGRDLHRELELLVHAGLSPLQALQSATISAARCMHREHDFGTVEAGKVADLVILKRNPLVDMSSLAEIEVVIRDGVEVQSKVA